MPRFGMMGGVWPRDYFPENPDADLMLRFDRQRYRLDGQSSRRFTSLPGASYTGGAGFKMARTKGGVWLPVAANEPGETDAGLGVWDARTNKSTNFNAKPTDLTGVSKSGEAAATLTLVDDTAALRAAGFGRLIDDGQMNGQVYKLDNSLGGSVSFVTFTGFTGNTNRHTGVIYLRGTGVGSQLRSSGGGAEGLTNYSLLPSYARVAVDLNALAGSRQLQLWVAAGSVVYFILNELKEGADINDPPIVTTGLPATRTADDAKLAISTPAGDYRITGGFATTRATGATRTLFDWNDGTDNNKVILEINSSNQVRLRVINGGVATTIATEGGTPAAARTATWEVRRVGGDWSLYVDGALAGTASASAPAATEIQFGNTRGLTAALNDWLTEFAVYDDA